MDIDGAEIYLKKNEKKLLAGGKSGGRLYDIGGAGLGCLPEVLDLRNMKDEILILMKPFWKKGYMGGS